MKTEYVEKALFPWVYYANEYTKIDDPSGNKLFINDRIKYVVDGVTKIGTISKKMIHDIMSFVILDDDPSIKRVKLCNVDIIEKIK